MKLSIAIVNWNTRDLLDQCLRSVYDTLDDLDAEVLVADNASEDGSREMVREKYPEVVMIEMPSNVGFAAANNAAYQHAKGEYFLLLNSDTIVQPGAFGAMVAAMDAHPDAGAVGCRLLNGDGTLQRSCSPFPTPTSELFDALYLSKIFPRSRLFGSYAMSYCGFDREMEVDFAGGSSLLLRREALERVGLLDEGYFMYSEETDLCYRLKKDGWKVLFTPAGTVIHLGGQSAKMDVKRTLVELYKSKYRFMRKHYGMVPAACYRGVVAVSALVRYLLWIAKAIAGANRWVYREKARLQHKLLVWAVTGVRR